MSQSAALSSYLNSLRFQMLFVASLFLLATALGYAGLLSEFFSNALKELQEFGDYFKGISFRCPLWASFFIFFSLIFLNNSFKCFLNIILGPILGIFPLFSTFINGGLLGFLARKEGLAVFLYVLPHGIFEIPAFLLSAAIGLKLSCDMLKILLGSRGRSGGGRGEGGTKVVSLKVEFGEALKAFIKIVLPLLFVAALIETSLILMSLER